MSRTQVLLDTNILLLCGTQQRNIFAEIAAAMDAPFEFIVLQPVLKELEKLAAKSSKEGKAAKLARILVEQKAAEQGGMVRRILDWRGQNEKLRSQPLKIVPSSHEYADDALLAIADGAVLCTLDKALQRRAKGRILSVKGKQFAFL